ncbi:MFS transporter [Cryobacterium luteum]|uniref:MFS transporter n=1 Tax=Cryobacterium luteum TaxID=1424661 RepID=A0A1H8MIR9_9MICO|nr:MFS transporter [Cryobacterium luteum]TFB94400.1 MFS transporter [Cryobacterium luteum]SEO17036.1 Predicted arabinose efflux permease, MFS family [Cryobacterium luteum]
MAQTTTRQPDAALLRRPGARPMLLAALIVTAVFVLSNSPTPLYVYWQRELGFSAGMLTVIFAAYMVGLLLTLTVAGQFADRFGRKSVLIPGLVLALVACSLFGVASSVLVLVIARFLTGVAVGVIVSAGMAAVVDLGGPARRRQASLAASVAMVFGAGLGPLLSGLFAQRMATPAPVIFAVEFVLLATALAIAIFLPLRRPPASQSADTAEARFSLHLPSVPKRNQRHLAYGIAVFAPGITATSFVLSLGPSLLSNLLNASSPLVAGGMACAMFLAATGVQFTVSRVPVRSILLLGSGATLAAMASLIIAVNAAVPAILILSALLAGIGQGLGQLGGLTLIGTHVPGNHRAEANAVLNIGGYIPAGLLSVATGYLINGIGLSAGATLFAAVLAVAAIAGGILVRRDLSPH